MKICLIYLPHPYLKQPNAQAPIGLLYLAAVLEVHGIDVELCNFSDSLTPEAVTSLPEADVYGISVTSIELPQANRFAYLVKERFGKSKIILGGSGTYSKEFVNWSVVDSICIGEGEQTILTMLEDVKRDTLQKVYLGSPINNLDTIPFPARHLMGDKQGGNIFAYNKKYKGTKSTIILTSRGCPYKCAFCGSPKFTNMSKGIRFRSSQDVVSEIKQVIDTFGIYQFRFSDDMFLAKRDRVFELCDLLKKLDIVWRISCRVKPFDYEIAKALKHSGCEEVSFGIESFDDCVLDFLNKGTTAVDNAKALEMCENVGIKSRVLFMIRTPGQRKETVPINIEWLKRVPYNIIACTSFVPIPGSDVWENPDKYNIEILNKNLDDYNFYFFGKNGENNLKNIIKIKDRPLNEFNAESQKFRDFLKTTGKLNKG